MHLYGDGYRIGKDLLAEFDRRSREYADRSVAKIAEAAKAAGVEFEACVEKSVKPYQAIIDAATEHKCDVIFMASHGQRGLTGLLLGSVTNNVLTHSKIPVLVFR
jgi:nucleotide-binding universal stress UspA family protein